MKSLKKILAAFMAIMLAFSLAACQEEEEVAPAGTTPIGIGSLKIAVLYTSKSAKSDDDSEKDAESEYPRASAISVIDILEFISIETAKEILLFIKY